MKFSLSVLSTALSLALASPLLHYKPDQILTSSSFAIHSSDDFPEYALATKEIDPASLGLDTVAQHSGYLEVKSSGENFFYWAFESRNDPSKDPVVLWLQGGPGSSSMFALTFENGPSLINNPEIKPIHNPWSWNNNATMIYLDQPAGAGFSYVSAGGTASRTSKEAAKSVFAFLTLFFEKYPHLPRKIHISGESYAGHYVPQTTLEILRTANKTFHVESMLCGNGMTDPLNQYTEFSVYGCDSQASGVSPALYSNETCQQARAAQDRCIPLIQKCYDTGTNADCSYATSHCNAEILSLFDNEKNIYDVRRPCEPSKSGTCYKESDYGEAFLNNQTTRDAIGAIVPWKANNRTVYNDFTVYTGDWMRPDSVRAVTDILNGYNVPVLIFAGDKDFICNWLGQKKWLDALPWDGHAKYLKARERPWKVNHQSRGVLKQFGKLSFLRIFEAGHMVPHDQPEAASFMLQEWLTETLGIWDYKDYEYGLTGPQFK
ncbi:Carboxypeptidase Y [Yarrowia sp. C11]|nr:Carboxypeptidase Y [Yarrowia sp. E02]KAG5372481.1 Carboxypeptidase Y [Yarrowia sp. C11]